MMLSDTTDNPSQGYCAIIRHNRVLFNQGKAFVNLPQTVNYFFNYAGLNFHASILI